MIPDGMDNDGTTNRSKYCFKLNRALYGLRQSGLEWYKLLDTILKERGYTNTISDPCVYYKYAGPGLPIMLTIYVDDVIIVYPKLLESVWLNDKQMIVKTYDIDDLDNIHFCLKMKIIRDRVNGTIKISQKGYIQSILEEFNMSDCTPSGNPMASANITDPELGDTTALNTYDHALYRSMIGTLMYLGNTTRIDITFSVHF